MNLRRFRISVLLVSGLLSLLIVIPVLKLRRAGRPVKPILQASRSIKISVAPTRRSPVPDDRLLAALRVPLSSGGHSLADEDNAQQKEQRISLVKELLAKGSSVNAQDQDGRTSLMWAAATGRTEIMRLLLKYGAAIDRQDAEGETALHQAVWGTQSEAAELLLKHHPNLKLKDRFGNTQLGLTSRVHHYPQGIIHMLQKAGAKWPPEGSN